MLAMERSHSLLTSVTAVPRGQRSSHSSLDWSEHSSPWGQNLLDLFQGMQQQAPVVGVLAPPLH